MDISQNRSQNDLLTCEYPIKWSLMNNIYNTIAFTDDGGMETSVESEINIYNFVDHNSYGCAIMRIKPLRKYY